MGDFHAEFAAHAQREREKATREVQAALFAPLEPLPPHNGTATSKAAAREVLHVFSARRDRIVDALAGRPDGMTRAELVTATGLKENSVNSAVASCVTLKLAVENDKWPTRDGRKILYHPDHAPRRQQAA